MLRYWVFRSWGRVGTTIGGNKLDKFHDKNSAMDNFLSVYKEKTGNSWGTANFTKYPNKFYPLEIDYGQVDTQYEDRGILQYDFCICLHLGYLCRVAFVSPDRMRKQ